MASNEGGDSHPDTRNRLLDIGHISQGTPVDIVRDEAANNPRYEGHLLQVLR
jgi:hypothetical protein